MTGTVLRRAAGRRYVVQLSDGRQVTASARWDLPLGAHVEVQEVNDRWMISAAARA